MLKIAKNKKEDLILADCHYLPIRDSSFEQVVGITILQNVYNKDLFWREVKRVLKNSGKAIITGTKRHLKDYQEELSIEDGLIILRKC